MIELGELACQSFKAHSLLGDWEAGRQRDASPRSEAETSEDESLHGDFEDIETGQKFSRSSDIVTAAAIKAIQTAATSRQEEKAAKKAVFNAEYDIGANSENHLASCVSHASGSLI